MTSPSSRARSSRGARSDGEEVLALNGKTYTLDPLDDGDRRRRGVHDIGGIMGGEHSGVHRGDHRRR